MTRKVRMAATVLAMRTAALSPGFINGTTEFLPHPETAGVGVGRFPPADKSRAAAPPPLPANLLNLAVQIEFFLSRGLR